jgi:integrase
LGETSLFLASREVTLDEASRVLFLDYLYADFGAAIRFLISRARGDYSPDEHPRQFPQFTRTPDPGLTPWMLFERWIAALKPARSTVDRWRAVFLQLGKDFPAQNVSSFTPEQARAWLNGLTNEVRTAATVRGTWLNAAKTVWGWALDQRLVPSNPFAGIRLPAPRRFWTRESKAFRTDEAMAILSAALAISDVGRKSAAAKRWMPWLCAYTGARSGEIAQLRGSDVIERDGVSAIRITPEAGTVKSRQTRVVPLHEHLIEQGFLGFVQDTGKGPLFYNPRNQGSDGDDPTNPRKPRYVRTREHIAEWVRQLGVNDSELQPNHAWRHTFKQIAERSGISERISDAITGHAPHTVGRSYGAPTLTDMADALRRFPRYL